MYYSFEKCDFFLDWNIIYSYLSKKNLDGTDGLDSNYEIDEVSRSFMKLIFKLINQGIIRNYCIWGIHDKLLKVYTVPSGSKYIKNGRLVIPEGKLEVKLLKTKTVKFKHLTRQERYRKFQACMYCIEKNSNIMDRGGLEPPTSRVQTGYSSSLNYRPIRI